MEDAGCSLTGKKVVSFRVQPEVFRKISLGEISCECFYYRNVKEDNTSELQGIGGKQRE